MYKGRWENCCMKEKERKEEKRQWLNTGAWHLWIAVMPFGAVMLLGPLAVCSSGLTIFEEHENRPKRPNTRNGQSQSHDFLNLNLTICFFYSSSGPTTEIPSIEENTLQVVSKISIIIIVIKIDATSRSCGRTAKRTP